MGNVVVEGRYEILEKEKVEKCLSNGEKVKCYRYKYKDLKTGETEIGYGDKDYNNAIPLEDVNNIQKGNGEINCKVIIGGTIAVLTIVAVGGGIIFISKNPQIAARISLPLAKRIFSVISKPNPRIIEPLYKDIFEQTKKILPFLTPTIVDLYNKAEGADGVSTDPLIFDLNGDGIKTTNIENGVYFDHENDGFAELSAWVDKNDGILVSDINNNQKIDNGTELVLYDKLSQYDSNSDGIIDPNDEGYYNLRILKGDGTILTLDEAGILSINTNLQNIQNIDSNGNKQFKSGTYTKKDGSINDFGGFMFETDTSNSFSTEIIEVSDEITSLPYIDGSGKLYDLHQAMQRDTSGTLQSLIEDFILETNDDIKMNLIEQMLVKWADAENIEIDSRGSNINAQHLVILEKFVGREFFSVYTDNENKEIINRIMGGSGGSDTPAGSIVGSPKDVSSLLSNPSNPNLEASQLLNTAYENLKLYIYSELMVQTNLKGYYEKIDIIYDVEANEIEYDLTH